MASSQEEKSSPCYRWEFDFPPYEIQKGFMSCLHETLQRQHCAILESPTGTGKSLSMICSALHWLSNPSSTKTDVASSLAESTDSPGEVPHWLSDAKHEQRKEDARRSRIQRARDRIHARIERSRRKTNSKRSVSQRKISNRSEQRLESDPFELEDYDSDKENGKSTYGIESERSSDSDSDSSSFSDSSSDSNDSLSNGGTKIFFASRTHSQLSQFLHEISRTSFAKEITTVSLGSRKQLCVHPTVSKLSNSSKLNESCKELLDKRTAKPGASGASKRTSTQRDACGCPYYQRGGIRKLRDHILYKVQDIEEVVQLGKEQAACAYYATRSAIQDAQLVALPYSMLLHRQTREALGIDLKGHVVICDEAHNIIDAVNQVHSVSVSLSLVEAAHLQLQAYHKRYRSRLLAKNKLYVGHLMVLLARLRHFLEKLRVPTDLKDVSRIVPVVDFAFQAQIDHVNMFKLLAYLETSHLAQKAQGLQDSMERARASEEGQVEIHKLHKRTQVKDVRHAPMKDLKRASMKEGKEKQKFPLFGITSFIRAMTNVDQHGSVLIVKDKQQPYVKFVMLDPAAHFGSLVRECRSVILAGGTMHPIDMYVQQLFGNIPRENVRVFSCGHVIPSKHKLSMSVGVGPRGTNLNLTFSLREREEVMDDIGNALVNICSVVPAGVVVFVSSYSYEQKLHDRWKAAGILARLETRKKVLRESRLAGMVERTLKEYAEQCQDGAKGAILFSVVGGKLSEGINFKDNLARCVCMVGMPYPYAMDPEIKARMDYLDTHDRTTGQQSAGNRFYENQCMKAVNQCIGRAIRHKGDYASIVLLDQRYSRNNVLQQLPKWITEGHHCPKSFGQALGLLGRFFAGHRGISF